MSGPVRVQLSRRAGSRLPENTVVVARPTIFGNPFGDPRIYGDAANRVELFRRFVDQAIEIRDEGLKPVEVAPGVVWPATLTELGKRGQKMLARLPELRGKNLACWCQPGAPCHADVLLELANREDPS